MTSTTKAQRAIEAVAALAVHTSCAGEDGETCIYCGSNWRNVKVHRTANDTRPQSHLAERSSVLHDLREILDLPDDPPGDAGLLRELDAFAYEMGVLAEADYCREEVSAKNAIDVLGRLRDLMTLYKDDSEELGDVQSWLFERVGHQEGETIFDQFDRLLAAAPADKPDEPAPYNLEPTTGMFASHRCRVCGAMWRKHDDGSWSLASSTCGKCCDNVAMGEQIEKLPADADAGTVDERERQIEDDGYRSLDHAMQILGSCAHPYTGEQAHKVAKVLRQWRDKWAAAVDCIRPEMPRPDDDERDRWIAEWLRRITDARFRNDTPAFDRALLDAMDVLRDRDAEVARLRAELDLCKQAHSYAEDNVEHLTSEVERLTKGRDEWERIADQRGHRLTQIATIVTDNKTALGFDPFCDNEIVDSVLMMRERAVKAEAELDRERGGWEALERLRDRMRTTAASYDRIEYVKACRDWANEADKALAARPTKEDSNGTR